MRIKICGLTNLEQAVAIADLGATDIGFVCVGQSPRYVTPSQIAAITAALPATVGKVGVFANAPQAEIAAVSQTGGLTIAQLHGDETPEFCQQLRQLLPDIEILKACRIRDRASLAQTHAYEPFVDGLLLDAYHPDQLGGTGKRINWDDLEQFRPRVPWFLAGGLNASNVAMAIAQLKPDGIDLSSGVEDAPGMKNLAAVEQLMTNLKLDGG